MTTIEQPIFRGVVHGKTIELDKQPGFPDGQEVSIMFLPILPPGEGVRQSAESWADAGEELDSWLEETLRSREQHRPEIT